MEFNDVIKQFSERILSLKDTITTEESTKMSLVVPLFQLLGYDVFNPNEFCPEYIADVGIKKGEKVDYAILENGQPNILVECKSCSEQLDKHSSQLFRYFGTSPAKFGILTNGIIYRFYTDLEESNKMDLVPFLEIDMANLKDSSINELKKFCKDNFDKDKIFSTAEELKYSSQIKNILTKQFESPTEDFVRFILADIYDGQKNQRIIEKFTPVVKRAFSSFVNEIVNSKISSALADDYDKDEESEPEIKEPASKIVTTEDEIESFYIIRGLLAGIVPVEDIVHRDKCISDLKANLPLDPDYTYVQDYYIGVKDDTITITAVVDDSTDPSLALDFADTLVRQLNLYAQMQDSSIESSSQNFYGGLYTRYNALVGVAPASKTNSQKDWFVYDGISGGKVMLKLNKQYR